MPRKSPHWFLYDCNMSNSNWLIPHHFLVLVNENKELQHITQICETILGIDRAFPDLPNSHQARLARQSKHFTDLYMAPGIYSSANTQ